MAEVENGRSKSPEEKKEEKPEEVEEEEEQKNDDAKSPPAGEADNKSQQKSNGSGLDREKVCPFLLRVFCSTTRHNPILDYNRGKVPANELQIYTWLDATLKELTNLIREVNPEARRRGTCFDFAVVFPNPGRNSAAHYITRDIGTTVSGQKGPDDSKTLKDCRFVIGDYLDVAITPPVSRNPGFDRRGRFGRGGMGGGGPGRRERRDFGDPDSKRFRAY